MLTFNYVQLVLQDAKGGANGKVQAKPRQMQKMNTHVPKTIASASPLAAPCMEVEEDEKLCVHSALCFGCAALLLRSSSRIASLSLDSFSLASLLL